MNIGKFDGRHRCARVEFIKHPRVIERLMACPYQYLSSLRRNDINPSVCLMEVSNDEMDMASVENNQACLISLIDLGNIKAT